MEITLNSNIPENIDSNMFWLSEEPFSQLEKLEVNKENFNKALSAEETIFGFSGLKVYDEINIFDVPIKFRGDQDIHTVRCGLPTNPSLVIIHGYGGSSVTFYKMIKDLSQKFQVFCIDLLGMGLSSRPKFEVYNTTECINFFVDSIEEWRKALKLEKFTLCGHSLGGYLSINYALKYVNQITKLVLMSPAGMNGVDDLNFEDYIKHFGFIRRQFLKFASKLWHKKYTPNKLYQKHGIIGRFVLKMYITKRWATKKEEALPLQIYFDKILSMPESSEACLHLLLKLPKARAIIPMEELIKKHLSKINVVFIYGDKDWMDSSEAMRLFKELPNVEFYKIKGAGHHANMDQPKEVCKIILGFKE